MPFVQADTEHPFTSAVRGAADGAQATFRIYNHTPNTGSGTCNDKLAEGQVPVTSGEARYTWRTQGPPTEGDWGHRSRRISFEVEVPLEGRSPLTARSTEVEVYHPWVELKTFREDGTTALAGAVFDLRVVNGTRTALTRRGLTTDSSGTKRIEEVPPGDVGIDFRPPYQLVEWQSGTGCKLKAKVRVCKLASFVTPVALRGAGASGRHKQFVNLDADAAKPEQGRTLKVKLRLADGRANDRIFVKLEFDAHAQSPRTDPAQRPTFASGGTTADWCPNGGKEITLASDGEEPEVEIDLGLAGGDAVTIHIGGENRCQDQRLEVTNWRRLYYEVMGPDSMSLSRATLDDGNRGKDFPDAMKRRMRQGASSVFIEYVAFKSHVFPASECTDGLTAADGTRFTKAYLGLGGSGDAFMLTDHTFRNFYPRHFDTGRSPRSVHLKLCDANWFRDESVTCEVTTDTPMYLFDLETFDGDGDGEAEYAARAFFPRSCFNGAYAVSGLRWEAVPGGAAAGHPGYSSGTTPKSGRVPAADLSTWVVPVDFKHFAINLPSGSDPASFCGPQDDAHCPVKLTIDFETAAEGLGMAQDHDGVMVNLIVYDTSSYDPVADVVLHELAHLLGQTTAPGGASPNVEASGVPARDDVDTVGSDGHRGDVYRQHGHAGPHCANGLSDDDKSQTDYSTDIAGRTGTCIMFGANSYGGASLATGFCPGCVTSIKARAMLALPTRTATS